MTSDGTDIYLLTVKPAPCAWWTSPPSQTGENPDWYGLLTFGDRDGKFEEALLQHVLGVAYHEGRVYVADTYNHKIKAADLEKRTIQTIAEMASRASARRSSRSSMNRVDLVSPGENSTSPIPTIRHPGDGFEDQSVETLHIDNTSGSCSRSSRLSICNPQPVVLQNEKVAPGGTVQIEFALPQGYHFNPLAQPMVQLRAEVRLKSLISQKFIPEVNGDVIQFKLRIRCCRIRKAWTLE